VLIACLRSSLWYFNVFSLSLITFGSHLIISKSSASQATCLAAYSLPCAGSSEDLPSSRLRYLASSWRLGIGHEMLSLPLPHLPARQSFQQMRETVGKEEWIWEWYPGTPLSSASPFIHNQGSNVLIKHLLTTAMQNKTTHIYTNKC
jgi:hypothetical protein